MKDYAIIYKSGKVHGMRAYNVCKAVGGWSVYGRSGGLYWLSDKHIKDIMEVNK